MNPLRYKTLLTYLPGMASVVNAFECPGVQAAVYDVLMEALNSKLDAEGLGRGEVAATTLMAPTSSGEVTHDLIEGDSIHSEASRKTTKAAAATVFG